MTAPPLTTTGLRAYLDAARAAWPGLDVPDDAFAHHLAGKLAAASDIEAALRSMRTSDLYLALGCARRDERALAELEHHYVPIMRAAIRKLGAQDAQIEEIVQELRCRLLLPRGERGPEIADYAGRGELAGWLRSVAVHAAFKLLKRDRANDSRDDLDTLLEQIPHHDDPAHARIAGWFSSGFREAFAEAMAALSPRERNLLRQQFVDGLNVDEIGALYKVHRATAARWLVKVRHKVLIATQRALRRRLELTPTELESLMLGLQSRLDITITRHLAA
ncbi:MAG: sigma-70 family RNA polymerase sigma factor [Kofleriaceae bacterium]